MREKLILLPIKVFKKSKAKNPPTPISSSICQEVTHSKKRICEAEVFSEGAHRVIMDGKLEISFKCNTAVKKYYWANGSVGKGLPYKTVNSDLLKCRLFMASLQLQCSKFARLGTGRSGR